MNRNYDSKQDEAYNPAQNRACNSEQYDAFDAVIRALSDDLERGRAKASLDAKRRHAVLLALKN